MRRGINSRIGLAAIAGCIAVGALAVAGCGGGGGSSTTGGASGASGASGSEPLTKDEFVSQVNAICQQGNQKIEALQAPPENAQASEVVPFLTQGLAIARDTESQLEALNPPSELQAKRDKLVADTQKKLALTDQALAAAKANDASKVQALLQQVEAIDKQDDALAKSLGMTECAKHVEPQG